MARVGCGVKRESVQGIVVFREENKATHSANTPVAQHSNADKDTMSTTPHAQRTHARLSPSKAHQWAVCTASTWFIEANQHRLPPDRSSAFADEGTTAHEVAESLLTGKPNKMPKKGVTAEMLTHCRRYVKWVKGLELDMEVESPVPIWYDEGEEYHGHVDVLCWREDEAGLREIHVIDFKYGKGQKVFAEHNHQMAIYAVGAIKSKWGEYRCENTPISLTIYQPRCQKDEGEGDYSTWKTTWAELDLWVTKNIEVPASIVLNPKAQHLLKFSPGEKTCRWCPAKSICEARAAWMFDETPIKEMVLQGAEAPPPDWIADHMVATVVGKKNVLKGYIDELCEYALQRHNMGKPVAGTKLVKGKGSRVWTNTADVTNFLSSHKVWSYDYMTEPELKSPAQIEKSIEEGDIILSREAIEDLQKLVKRVEGAPVITTLDDKRTTVDTLDATTVFDYAGDPWD